MHFIIWFAVSRISHITYSLYLYIFVVSSSSSSSTSTSSYLPFNRNVKYKIHYEMYHLWIIFLSSLLLILWAYRYDVVDDVDVGFFSLMLWILLLPLSLWFVMHRIKATRLSQKTNNNNDHSHENRNMNKQKSITFLHIARDMYICLYI